jgi:molybdopterin-binding protein
MIFKVLRAASAARSIRSMRAPELHPARQAIAQRLSRRHVQIDVNSYQRDRKVSMKLSARNILKGKIVEVKKGQTTAHVRIDLGGGSVVTASITNEAVDELKLAAGQSASAVIKASDVMIAID